MYKNDGKEGTKLLVGAVVTEDHDLIAIKKVFWFSSTAADGRPDSP